jgi:hypothetical protein
LKTSQTFMSLELSVYVPLGSTRVNAEHESATMISCLQDAHLGSLAAGPALNTSIECLRGASFAEFSASSSASNSAVGDL